MGLEIDMTLPARGVTDLRKLVRAISQATDADESECVEWKSDLQLDKRSGCFHVARAILGMANRNPVRAAKWFGGYGYVVVGAEAGSIAGTAVVDSVEYGVLIESYVGGEFGPSWTPVSVDVDGLHVMVFMVEPPKPGDPIWPLRREYDGNAAGRVFIRKPGATRPALAPDIDMLSDRAAEASRDGPLPEIAIDLLGTTPASWYDSASLKSEVAHWIDGLRDAMVDHAERVQRERDGELEPGEARPSTFRATQLGIGSAALSNIELFRRSMQERQDEIARALSATHSTLGGALSSPDERSLDEYRVSVEKWAKRSRKTLFDSFTGYFSRFADVAFWVRIENRSDRFLSDVQVKVNFPWEPAHASHDKPEAAPLPNPPRAFGQPKPAIVIPPIPLSGLPGMDYFDDQSVGRRTWIEDGSINLTFDVGTLRPRDTDTSDAFWLLLPARPENGTLSGNWSMTAAGIHAVIEGAIEIAVDDAPVRVNDVLDREAQSGESEQGS